MLPKLLAWVALALAIIGTGLGLTAVFAGSALGTGMAGMLVLWGVVPLAIIAVLLAVVLLVLGSLQS
ncbi:MAG: hypothetical protein ACOYK7_12800 [Pirellulales bacterium]|jgi:hypothetical protein